MYLVAKVDVTSCLEQGFAQFQVPGLVEQQCVQDGISCLQQINTVEPVLKDRPIGDKNMHDIVSQNRWYVVTGSFILKCRTSCQKLVVLQDR